MHLMNYGTNSSENSDAGILQEQSTTDCPSDMTKAWDDYYNYCNQQHSGTRSESMATSEDANYTLDNYYHYYAYHYGEEYAQEWLKMRRDEQDDDNEETTPSVMDQESESKDDDTKASVKGKKKGKDVKQKPDEQPACKCQAFRCCSVAVCNNSVGHNSINNSSNKNSNMSNNCALNLLHICASMPEDILLCLNSCTVTLLGVSYVGVKYVVIHAVCTAIHVVFFQLYSHTIGCHSDVGMKYVVMHAVCTAIHVIFN